MKIQNTNSLTFNAKLNTAGLGKNAVYWESIAKKFEEQTASVSNAELRLLPNMIQYVNINKNKKGCHVFLTDGALNKVLNKPMYKIVNTMVKLFNIGHTTFNTLEEAEKFANVCEKLDNKINDFSAVNQFDVVYNSALKLVNRYIISEAKTDDILKKWQINP